MKFLLRRRNKKISNGGIFGSKKKNFFFIHVELSNHIMHHIQYEMFL
jgi:hypothetical protein